MVRDHPDVYWLSSKHFLYIPIDGESLDQYREESNSMASGTADSYDQINIYPNPMLSGNPQLMISGYEGIEENIETHIEIINMTGEVVFADRILRGGNCTTYLMNINKQLVPGVSVNMKTNGTRNSKRLLAK